MRLLVFGGSGMLGQEVVLQAAERGHTVEAPNHFRCDISDIGHLLQFTETFDGVINCAGVVPGSKEGARGMILSNALGPHMIAKIIQAHIVHVSTDCVYSGRQPRNGMWASDQLPDPIDLYGRSKLCGELQGDNVLTVRTSFLGLRHGLLPWILRSKGTVEGWICAYWNGGSVGAVAQKLLDFSEARRTGLVHLAAAEPVSKAWIIEYVLDQMKKNVNVTLVDKPRIWRALAPDVELPPVKESLDELLEEHRHGS